MGLEHNEPGSECKKLDFIEAQGLEQVSITL